MPKEKNEENSTKTEMIQQVLEGLEPSKGSHFAKEENEEYEALKIEVETIFERKYQRLRLLNKLSLLLLALLLISLIAACIATFTKGWYQINITDATSYEISYSLLKQCSNNTCTDISTDAVDDLCSLSSSEMAVRVWGWRGNFIVYYLTIAISIFLGAALVLRPTRKGMLTIVCICLFFTMFCSGAGILVFVDTYSEWRWCQEHYCTRVQQLNLLPSSATCSGNTKYPTFIFAGACVFAAMAFITALIFRAFIFSVERGSELDANKLRDDLEERWMDRREQYEREQKAERERREKAAAALGEEEEEEEGAQERHLLLGGGDENYKEAASSPFDAQKNRSQFFSSAEEEEDETSDHLMKDRYNQSYLQNTDASAGMEIAGATDWVWDPSSSFYFSPAINSFWDPHTQKYYDVERCIWRREPFL